MPRSKGHLLLLSEGLPDPGEHLPTRCHFISPPTLGSNLQFTDMGSETKVTDVGHKTGIRSVGAGAEGVSPGKWQGKMTTGPESNLQMKGSAAGMVPGDTAHPCLSSGVEPRKHLIATNQLDCAGGADTAGDCHPNARFLLCTSGCSHWRWGWGAQ